MVYGERTPLPPVWRLRWQRWSLLRWQLGRPDLHRRRRPAERAPLIERRSLGLRSPCACSARAYIRRLAFLLRLSRPAVRPLQRGGWCFRQGDGRRGR